MAVFLAYLKGPRVRERVGALQCALRGVNALHARLRPQSHLRARMQMDRRADRQREQRWRGGWMCEESWRKRSGCSRGGWVWFEKGKTNARERNNRGKYYGKECKTEKDENKNMILENIVRLNMPNNTVEYGARKTSARG